MQILANALPGFRDLRAPLTAGYLWLLSAWLIARPDISKRPDQPVAATLYDLGSAVGPLWIGLAVSTLAYLVGSISQAAIPELLRARRRQVPIVEADQEPNVGAWLERLTAGPVVEAATSPTGSIGKIRAQYVTTATVLARTAFSLASADPESSVRALRASASGIQPKAPTFDLQRRCDSYTLSALNRALQEPDLPATLLVGDKPELFAEVDRLRAEGDLRLTVAPPLIGLVAFGVVSVSWWWGLGFLAVVALALQGSKRVNESRRMISAAIDVGRIQSPAVADHAAQMGLLVKEADQLV